MMQPTLDSMLESLCDGDPAAAERVFVAFEPYLRFVRPRTARLFGCGCVAYLWPRSQTELDCMWEACTAFFRISRVGLRSSGNRSFRRRERSPEGRVL
jgi:hypothetical protein